MYCNNLFTVLHDHIFKIVTNKKLNNYYTHIYLFIKDIIANIVAELIPYEYTIWRQLIEKENFWKAVDAEDEDNNNNNMFICQQHCKITVHDYGS